MSKKTVKKQDAIIRAQQSLEQAINDLRDRSVTWHANEYKKSEEILYVMLADIYETYQLMNDSSEESRQKRKMLHDRCLQEELPFKKSAHIVELLVKLVFQYNKNNQQRLSTYTRCLKRCIEAPSVYSSKDVAEFIDKSGGIEALVRNGNSKSVSVKQKTSAAKQSFSSVSSSTLVSFKEATDNATELNGSYVVLVGQVNASGNIEVKHMCADKAFGNRKKNFGATAVNAALANMGTVIDSVSKSNQETVEAEQASEDVNAQFIGVTV